MELPKSDVSDTALASLLLKCGESLNGDHRVVPFELSDDHEVPTAEMPWDALKEAEGLPEGYTDEEEKDEFDE